MQVRNLTITLIAIVASLCSAQALRAQEIKTYTYDTLGRLTQVSTTGTITINATYCYDKASNRKSVKVNGVGSSVSTSALRCNGPTGTDFNGDGINDILWRNDAGDFSNWLGTQSGAFVGNDGNAFMHVSTDWKVVGTGDFNGDGIDDVLWRNTSTWAFTDWLGTPAGGYVVNDANALVTTVGSDWKVVGIGDFNGDGMSDILWRNNSGQLSDWLGRPNGSFAPNDTNALQMIGTDWKVAGTGDFNGDHRDDIVWRNDSGEFSEWLGQTNGGFVSNGGIAGAQVITDWKIAGVADFNGDGRSDVLWRKTSNGQIANWLANPNGSFTDNASNSSYMPDLSWSVVAVNDYNGDGYGDILWRKSDGALSDWLGTSVGAFTNNGAVALTYVPTNWYVLGPSTF